MNQFRVGAYLSPKGAVRKAKDMDADSVSIFLGNPRSFSGPLSILDKDQSEFPTWIHAPYSVCIPHHDPWVKEASVKLLKEHAQIAADIGALGVVVHGGSWKKSTHIEALMDWEKVASMDFPVRILIENQSGGKTSVSRHLEDVWKLNASVRANPNFGWCLDTAHVWGALDPESTCYVYTRKFKSVVEDRIWLIHANGSSVELGSGADRHSPFADSTLPLDTALEMIRVSGCEDMVVESRDPESDVRILKESLNVDQ